MSPEVTQLPPEKEAEFQAWLRTNGVTDLDHPDSHYDYRGAFLAGEGRGADSGHFTDRFKEHGHPTFSEESKYSKGPGDGGTWQGEKFLPGYAVLHGLPGTPYGMGRGPVRLEGINDQPGQRFGGPPPLEPEQINLDEPSAPLAPAQPQQPSGWRVKNAKGEVVASIAANPKAGQDYQKFQVQNVGQSLLSQAVTPEEKEAATRALAYGMSLVGTMDVDKIQKEIVHRYDTDTGYAEKRGLQTMRTRNRGVGGPGGPVGPTKADKWGAKLNADLYDRVDKLVAATQGSENYKKISDLENETNLIETQLNSANAMSDRVAVQRLLLQLTGKASRESEQSAITGAAGKWNEFENKLRLWTSDDPRLTQQFINQFRGLLGAQKKFIADQKEKIGRSAAAAVRDETVGYSDEERLSAADVAYGRITGRHTQEYKPAHERAAAKPAPAQQGGGFDPDL